MCFNRRVSISTLDGRSLKFVDKFTYHWSSVSSTKNDINMWLAKAWTAIDRLSVIWKSVLSDKIKRSFFQAAVMVMSILPYGCWLSVRRESSIAIAQECCKLYWTSPGDSITQRSSCMNVNHLKIIQLDKQDKQDTAGEVRARS